MKFDLDIDAIGLLCPLPVLRLRKRIAALTSGQIARLMADDPAAQIDVPHFCAEQGHIYLGSDPLSQGTAYFVQKS
ncbi:MAG: tRNA 2-thiouridine synthesizing protein A [Paracoccaceae bacterium]|jgi:tRNA 2-thiouridine synthesizing protein A